MKITANKLAVAILIASAALIAVPIVTSYRNINEYEELIGKLESQKEDLNKILTKKIPDIEVRISKRYQSVIVIYSGIDAGNMEIIDREIKNSEKKFPQNLRPQVIR